MILKTQKNNINNALILILSSTTIFNFISCEDGMVEKMYSNVSYELI